MENYIYQSWIYMFSISLGYQDDTEKLFYFEYMLNILEKLNWIDNEILNILCMSIIQNGDDSMVVQLYQHFLTHKYPSADNYFLIANIMDRLGGKNKDENIKPTDKKYSVRSSRSYINSFNNLNMYIIDRPTGEVKFRERSINTKTEFLRKFQISFDNEDNCMECNGILNIEILSVNYEKMKKNLFWAVCPNCKNNVVPKLGIDVIYGDSQKQYKDKVLLYSPFHLKYNYDVFLLKEYNLQLDVNSFCKKYSALFWNSIWYFSQIDLPFAFLMPYVDNSEVIYKSISSFSKLEIQNYVCDIFLKTEPKSTKSRFNTQTFANEDSEFISDSNSFINVNVLMDCSSFKSEKRLELPHHPDYKHKFSLHTERIKRKKEIRVRSVVKSMDLTPNSNKDNIINQEEDDIILLKEE